MGGTCWLYLPKSSRRLQKVNSVQNFPAKLCLFLLCSGSLGPSMLEIEVVGIRDRLEETVEVTHFTQQPSSAYPGLMQMEGHPQPTWREMDNKCTLGGKICPPPLEPNPVAKTVRSACYPAFRSQNRNICPHCQWVGGHPTTVRLHVGFFP